MYKVTVHKTYILHETLPSPYTDAEERMIADVRAEMQIPFAPYPNLELKDFGAVESVIFDTDTEEFFIRIKDEKVIRLSDAALEAEQFNGQLDYFIQTACEGWKYAFVDIRWRGTRHRYWVKDEKIQERKI